MLKKPVRGNWYQFLAPYRTCPIRYQNLVPEKNRCKIACHTYQKLLPVFLVTVHGTGFLSVCHWQVHFHDFSCTSCATMEVSAHYWIKKNFSITVRGSQNHRRSAHEGGSTSIRSPPSSRPTLTGSDSDVVSRRLDRLGNGRNAK